MSKVARLKQNPILRFVLFPYIWIKRQFIRRSVSQFNRNFDRIFKWVGNESLTIYVPNFEANYEISTRSLMLRHILKEGGYEPELTEIIDKYLNPEGDVIDIGANVGLFSVYFAKRLNPDSRILAAEPNPGAIRKLKRNLQLNEVANVILYEGALSENGGELELHGVPGMEEYSSLNPISHMHARQFDKEVFRVATRPLDGLVSEYDLVPGFVKMDVEGAEYEVLKGARALLKDHQPILLSEMDDSLLTQFGTRASEVVLFLEDFGYQVIDARTGGKPRGGFSDTILALPAKG